MAKWMDAFLNGIDTFLAWFSTLVHQTNDSYCELETADSPTVLVTHDGSLLSVIRVSGVTTLIGAPEFTQLCEGFSLALQTAMARPGHCVQVLLHYDRNRVLETIEEILEPAQQTAEQLRLSLKDLFEERKRYLSEYMGYEVVYLVLWTRVSSLSNEQRQRSTKEKLKLIREKKIPPFQRTQNIIAAVPDLRDAHDAFVRSVLHDMGDLNIEAHLLEVHDAIYSMRDLADPDFTDRSWRPILPGDKIPLKTYKRAEFDISDISWPDLSRQVLPRDGEVSDLRTTRVGDRIYSCVYIDLLPKETRPFLTLFQKTVATHIPWRISFLLESDGLSSLRFKSLIASILSFSSAENRLLSDATNLLRYISINTDDAVIRFKVTAITWAPEGEIGLLRTRTAELAKAIESWGSCTVSEVSGDPFGGYISSLLGLTTNSVATPTVLPLSEAVYLLPMTRPASPWQTGAILFRTPDGKPWPFQPGSREQTTWIDLIYARPGSGKSVLSNALNLALCLSPGLQRLPRIAIIDIGPSSSGLISLLKEALPPEESHLVAYHRIRMTPNYALNPFDTQLGCRFPTPQERSFLVNFLTLLATPLGAKKTYDGIADMAGLVVDELYKNLADGGKPYTYTVGVEPIVDGILEEIGFIQDQRTTWWEVTDALFLAGFTHEAMLAQRYAMPLVSDAASICRTPIIEDLYGKITAPTGESLINAFARMISSAVREYPILSRVTSFDLGDARVVSLDLDEVAKSGGEAADRQTAVMYMLARYILARHYYLSEDNLTDMPEQYREYHSKRINELREDPKRIILDEFHRTSKAQAVRDQVVLDMREGRKWNVQVALLSQSLEDFDPIMVEFATSIYVMEAGPTQAIEKSAKTFGLSPTAQTALRTRVHGPRPEGVTFLAQFSTKARVNTQLLTLTLGPVELWAFSTTVEDVTIRNKLYRQLGPAEARRVLATLFPSGSITKFLEKRLISIKEEQGIITEDIKLGVIDELLKDILEHYSQNPNFKQLTGVNLA